MKKTSVIAALGLCAIAIIAIFGFSIPRASSSHSASTSPTTVDHALLTPGPKEKCAVCGMFVAKYPDWVAHVTFRDNETVFFDGAKDMFKYLFNLKKYAPSRSRKDISSVYVTGYYNLKPLLAGDAWFVKGSDIFGPMGHELVPFASQADALEFMQDHKGQEILRLGDVDPQVIGELD